VSIGSTPITRQNSRFRKPCAKSAFDLGTINPSCIESDGTPSSRAQQIANETLDGAGEFCSCSFTTFTAAAVCTLLKLLKLFADMSNQFVGSLSASPATQVRPALLRLLRPQFDELDDFSLNSSLSDDGVGDRFTLKLIANFKHSVWLPCGRDVAWSWTAVDECARVSGIERSNNVMISRARE
jgi:hypothetical protein